jgi:hypothetical protein
MSVRKRKTTPTRPTGSSTWLRIDQAAPRSQQWFAPRAHSLLSEFQRPASGTPGPWDDEKRHIQAERGGRSINRALDGSKTTDVDVTDSQINITAGKEIPGLI